MAITGEKLLRIARYDKFEISEHALDRMRERTGSVIGVTEARQAFLEARQLTVNQLVLLGYRPRYEGRRRRGEVSLYFAFRWRDCELVAVLTEDQPERRLAWVTTYALSPQTQHFRVFSLDNLPDAA